MNKERIVIIDPEMISRIFLIICKTFPAEIILYKQIPVAILKPAFNNAIGENPLPSLENKVIRQESADKHPVIIKYHL